MLNILYEKYDLSRRCVTIHMETLSFHEFLELSEKKMLAQYSLDAKLIESGVPYKVNIARLSRTLGITPPTLNTYLDILNDTKIFHSIKKYSTKISRKPEKLLI